MWSGLTDSETPFTDFHVEEDAEGLPRAVFDRLPPEQSSLLSFLLYPDKGFVRALYLDILKVSEGEITGISYEDDFFLVTFLPNAMEIESKEPDSRIRVKLSLGEAKFLLLKWAFECIKWEASQYSPEEVVRLS